jgi:hypothetical protein
MLQGCNALKPERRVVGNNNPSLEIAVVDLLGGTGGRAAAALGNDIVLDKAGGGCAVNTIAEEQVGTATKVAGNLAGTGSLKELLLERSRVLAKVGGVGSNESGHDTGSVRAGH